MIVLAVGLGVALGNLSPGHAHGVRTVKVLVDVNPHACSHADSQESVRRAKAMRERAVRVGYGGMGGALGRWERMAGSGKFGEPLLGLLMMGLENRLHVRVGHVGRDCIVAHPLYKTNQTVRARANSWGRFAVWRWSG